MPDKELSAEGTIAVRRYVEENGSSIRAVDLSVGDGHNAIWSSIIRGEHLYLKVRTDQEGIDFLSSTLTCSDNHLQDLEPRIGEFIRRRPGTVQSS